jgi:hypothetical protein
MKVSCCADEMQAGLLLIWRRMELRNTEQSMTQVRTEICKYLTASLFCVLFSFSNNQLCGQNTDESKLFTPEQLREDADYFFNTLQNYHPNIYYYCEMSEFEQKKRHVYEQLTTSMTQEQFSLILCTMNPCLDTHAQIPIYFLITKGIQNVKEREEFIFPEITLGQGVQNNLIYTKIDNKPKEILFINGMETQKMVSKIQEFKGNFPSKRAFNPDAFPFFLNSLFNIHPPFTVEYAEKDKKISKEIKGIPLNECFAYQESEKEGEYIKENSLIYYEIYPASSIAILSIHSFRTEVMDTANFHPKMKALSDTLRKMEIKNLFIDVSKNGGGQFEATYQVYDYFQHDTIYLGVSKITRETNGRNTYIPYTKTIIRLPQRDSSLFNGNLFVLQGWGTFSCGDTFCRIVAQNKLGALIGSDTKTYTKDFGYVYTLNLPHTDIQINFPTTFLDFSHDFHTETLAPDMYWDINSKLNFSEKELLEILNAWNKKHK